MGIPLGLGPRLVAEAAALGGQLDVAGREDDEHSAAAVRSRPAVQVLIAETPGGVSGCAGTKCPAHPDDGRIAGGAGIQADCALALLPIRLARQIREQSLDRDPPASR